MEGDVAALFCANPACKYSETGQCVEGNALSDCTHLQEAAVEPAEVVPNADSPPDKPSLIPLGGDGHLSLEGASALMKREPSPLVAFLGPVAAGKTSLIAEVYDGFQYAQYKTLKFAGSSTLTVFEQISHSVRGAARTESPMLDRTEFADDPSLFHLRIASDIGVANVLLADRSGETYRQIADAPKRAADCLELQRASIINVLVDGERLCGTATRAGVIAQCAHAVQALALTGMLGSEVDLNLVLTKLDVVDSHVNRVRAHSDFDALPDKIRTQCDGLVGEIFLHRIAACPHSDLYEKGHGVEELVRTWVRSKPRAGKYEAARQVTPKRNIDRTPCSVEALQ